MIHWPEKLKWIEGKSSRIKYLQGAVRTIANVAENVFVRLSSLPKSGVYQGKERKEKIIVSLTSFPARINQCYYAIKSLMNQSIKADKIILWLATPQFPDKKLPANFQKLIDRGLEIRFTDDDLKSHKKYYYALKEQKPGEVVVTFDDDLIYEGNALRKLIDTHRKHPGVIVVNRGVKLNYDPVKGYHRGQRGKVLYNDEGVKEPSHLIVPSTGAGCLYPYGVLKDMVFNKDDIRNLAFSADDLWIWYNCLISKTGVIKTKKESRVLCEVVGSQKENLSAKNDLGGENDKVLHRLIMRGTLPV